MADLNKKEMSKENNRKGVRFTAQGKEREGRRAWVSRLQERGEGRGGCSCKQNPEVGAK